MCGIAGFTGNNESKIGKILSNLAHRGPDTKGIFCDDFVSLGQTRLSIIDLSNSANQPMFYSAQNGACSKKINPKLIEKANIGIVFNGEIYNFKEIKTKLSEIGYTFTTNSDTELVLAAYNEFGKDAVNYFNGMWAFCIYDKKKSELFLSRDRFGQKPLYYYADNETFVFGSEMKVFFDYGIEKQINTDSLNYYLMFGITPKNQSILNKIKKIEPGENLIYDLNKKQIKNKHNYYKINFDNKNIDIKTAKENVYNLLEKSVKRRLLADVPIGAFLSGGIDSSAIVYFMRKYVKDLKTFSISFDYQEFNEADKAKIISDKFNTEHYQINFSANDVRELIDIMPYYFDEPLGDSSLIPTYLVSKVAAEHVKVVLSGTGSDEIFAGYQRYYEYKILSQINKLPSQIKNIIAKSYSIISNDNDRVSKLKILLQSPQNQLYLKLFSNAFRVENEYKIDIEKLNYLTKYFIYKDKLHNVLNFEQNIYLPDDLLVKEDRATMANSIEGRMPFLDYELVNYVNSLNSSLKLKGKTGKYLLKQTLKGILPDEILFREKKGFGVPLKYYYKKELKKYTEDIIFGFSAFDYYNKTIVEKLWKSHQEGISDYSHVFWNLIMFNKWYETHIK
ncbi:MAG: asparagine synthase (glutamine-hydrolyzing) [Bacteroidales bacterium]|nr:asparagine synthase (glutamine-hydrolyzing) [Bacteroidales bacterium]MBN2756502.1 asparagine synthase (glutamine-hydrolyzing) [Bacteroidales bacterium]